MQKGKVEEVAEKQDIDLDLETDVVHQDVLAESEQVTDDVDWDTEDSFLENEQREESFRIDDFLKQAAMVRCERYNANLTSIGCKRKKESSPPRVKNSSMSDEESLQNHPCFGCVGPIIINWDVDSVPVSLKSIEAAPVIMHPRIDDKFSNVENWQNEEYRDGALPPPPSVTAPATNMQTGEIVEPDSATKRAASVGKAPVQAPVVTTPAVEKEVPKAEESPAKAESPAPTSKKETENKVEAKTSEAEPEEKATETAKVDVEIAPQEEVPTPKAKAKKPKAKSKAKKSKAESKDIAEDEEAPKKPAEAKSKAKKSKTKSEDATTPEKSKKAKSTQKGKAKASKKSADFYKNHPPCANCGKEYTAKEARYWRGDICNACYAKKLRAKRKDQSGKPKKQKKSEKDHPPCANCGKEYTAEQARYWRGDICNACYAKKLRAKRKEESKAND